MKLDGRNLKAANGYKCFEFSSWKGKLFDFVKGNFSPIYKDEFLESYVFYIDNKELIFKYQYRDELWVYIIDGDVVLNKYAKEDEGCVDDKGFFQQWYTYVPHSCVEEDAIKEVDKIIGALEIVKKEQQQGTRKIKFPKKDRHGYITRKDFEAGLSDEGKEHYWALKFTKDHIKYIDKEPTIAPITLREYFRLCRQFYLANEYVPKCDGKPEELTWLRFRNIPEDPKEAYMRFADGRTDQMDEVDLDDPQDFYDWAKREGRWKDRSQGGHPNEISGKTYLRQHYTDGLNGYFVWSSFIWTYNEVAEFCKEPNVMLSDHETLVKIINGEGKIRVTPFSTNRYGYPNKEFDEPISYDNLSRKQKYRVVWDELEESQFREDRT